MDTSPSTILVRFTPATIHAWTPEGLTYRTDSGELRTILFETCRRNWIDFVLTSGDFRGPFDRIQESRGVAWRDYFANPPYIEFFSEPRTRFIFPRPARWLRWWPFGARHGSAHFRMVQQAIGEMGWTSFDLG